MKRKKERKETYLGPEQQCHWAHVASKTSSRGDHTNMLKHINSASTIKNQTHICVHTGPNDPCTSQAYINAPLPTLHLGLPHAYVEKFVVVILFML